MSDYNQIDGAALDRYITGNYGENQYRGLIECPDCEGQGNDGDNDCPRCDGEGFLEEVEPDGSDPDKAHDEARERELFSDEADDEEEQL